VNAATVPDSMSAVVIRRHGGPEVLAVESVPTPQPGPGEILVRVEATALNHLDIFARQGLTGPGVHPIHLPHVSGVDVAGIVVGQGIPVPGQAKIPPIGLRVLINSAIGCGECRWCRRGEPSMCPDYRILGEHLWGGLAEYVVVPARNVIPIPDHVPSTVAAAVPAVYTTAWRGVVTVAGVKASDRVLVVGASGGLGSAQLQVAVAAGAQVIGTASTGEKRQKALHLGASAMFDSTGDWESEVMRWTDGQGVDAVFDSVGGPTLRHSVRCLAMGGALVISGATGGDKPDLSIREIYQRHRRILGAPMGNWEDFLQVTGLVWRGLLHPQIHAVYRLNEIADAERELEERRHFGKIVIRVDDRAA
jgi:NADPH:quinone reductase-like Zn-dependent oxidoreductase